MSMIAHDRILLDDDGHGWVVFDKAWPAVDQWDMLDRLCNTCGGTKIKPRPRAVVNGPIMPEYVACDCIDGRHTWTAEIEGFWDDKAGAFVGAVRDPRSVRLSVVPDMVLLIEFDGDGHDGDHPHVCACETVRGWAFFPMPTGDDTVAGVPFPAAAKPGDWAVRVRWEKVTP